MKMIIKSTDKNTMHDIFCEIMKDRIQVVRLYFWKNFWNKKSETNDHFYKTSLTLWETEPRFKNQVTAIDKENPPSG